MTQGAWILLAAVALACAFGGYRMLRDGRFRPARAGGGHAVGRSEPSGGSDGEADTTQRTSGRTDGTAGEAGPASGQEPRTAAASVLADTGHQLGERATLLQFSSAFCAPCRVTRVVLADVASAVPGVEHVEVDAELHLDLVRRLGIHRTPTTLILDPQGREVSRASGAPRKHDVLAALAPLA